MSEKQLTEGHIVREYKGFELDWNDDGIDPDEGEANFNVYIKYNGKELTKDAYGKELVFHGFNQAKRWIDENVKEVEYTPSEKLKLLADMLADKSNLDIEFSEYIHPEIIVDNGYWDGYNAISYSDGKYYLTIRESESIRDLLDLDNLTDKQKVDFLNNSGLYDEVWTEDDEDLEWAYVECNEDKLTIICDDFEDLLNEMSIYGFANILSQDDYDKLLKAHKLVLNGKPLKESKPPIEKAWAYEVYRVLDGELLATGGRLRSYEIAVKYAEEAAQAYEEQGYGECSYDVFEDTDPTPMWNRKKTIYESRKLTKNKGQILKRGDLSKYKISNKKLEEVRRREMINENTITGTLPPSIDKFLMDMSQMYIDDLSYTDISKFGDRATEDDINQLRKYKRELSQGFEEDDPEIQEIFKNIKNIVKGNLNEDTNISIDNMEVNIDKVKNKSVKVDEDHQLEEIPPHDRDQLLIELKDITNDFTIPNDTIVVGYESEKYYVIDILSENGYECENSMKGEWFEISFSKKKEKSLVEDIKEEKYNMGSNKLNITEEEKQKLEDLASKLMANSPNDYKYQVEETYEDYGSGMKWFNIICYNRSGDSWQVLNTKEWLDLMNTDDIDSVYQSVVNDKYFQDKQKELHEMNLGELFNYVNSI